MGFALAEATGLFGLVVALIILFAFSKLNMKSFLSLLIASVAINTELFAAEAGMPQLDPTYWASQAFWLILVFTVLYISISKFYLPKIKDNLDNRENKIKEDLENANKFKEV